MYGYDTIAMAVERSASEETVLVDGVPVNHQYSKSLEFERLLAGLVGHIDRPGLTYGSALRPYSELAIARAFAPLTRYHSTFCSCNTVFRQTAGADDALVRRVRQVPVRRADAGPVHDAGGADRGHRASTCSPIPVRSPASPPS